MKKVNENPNAGWKAAINDRFSNATVKTFKSLYEQQQSNDDD